MRLLHGSNVEIVQPNLAICQSMNDFGRGFYLTPQWQRAYLMAKRRASRDGGEPVVNPFLYYPTASRAWIESQGIQGIQCRVVQVYHSEPL